MAQLTSLVEICDIEIVAVESGYRVSSLEFAKRSGKLHKNVLRDIDLLISKDTGGRLKFEPSFYIDPQNVEQRMFLMSRVEVSVLISRQQGIDALQWTIQFFKAFEELEHRIALALRQENLQLQHKLEIAEAQKLKVAKRYKAWKASKVPSAADADCKTGDEYWDYLVDNYSDCDTLEILNIKLRWQNNILSKIQYNNDITKDAITYGMSLEFKLPSNVRNLWSC